MRSSGSPGSGSVRLHIIQWKAMVIPGICISYTFLCVVHTYISSFGYYITH